MLTFEEKEHIYKWDGAIVPGVTDIISEWIELPKYNIYVNKNTGKDIPADTFKAAGYFGTAIHKAIKLLIEDNLDWKQLDESLLPALNQFKIWWLTEGKKLKDFMVIDIKTGNSDHAAAQLAAYAQLILENDLNLFPGIIKCEMPLYSAKYMFCGTPDLILNYKKGILPKRYILKLPKNGDRAKLIEVTGKTDWIYFQSKLTSYNYIKERNK